MLDMDVIRNAVREAASQYPVKRVELFGSYANGSATEKSDVDFLVEFNDSSVSLLKLFGFQEMLIELLKMDVDVVKLPLKKNTELLIENRVCVYES